MTWNDLRQIMETQLTEEQMQDDVAIYDSGQDEFFHATDCHWTPLDPDEGLGAGILSDDSFFLEI